MEWVDPAVLIELFREQAEEKRRRAAWVENDIRFEDERKRKLKEKQEKGDEDRFEQLVEATAAQIAAFRETLDEYDTATVRALMENQRALDEVHDRRGVMEAAAHRLPDGRLVFKTEDGKRVFDKDGVQLSHEVVHPDAVPDSAPRWETYKANKDTERALLHDRDKLHEYQRHLDETREAIDRGHISVDALERMDADLRKAMPDIVKAHLARMSVRRSNEDPQDAPMLARTTRPMNAGQAPAGP